MSYCSHTYASSSMLNAENKNTTLWAKKVPRNFHHHHLLSTAKITNNSKYSK